MSSLSTCSVKPLIINEFMDNVYDCNKFDNSAKEIDNNSQNVVNNAETLMTMQKT